MCFLFLNLTMTYNVIETMTHSQIALSSQRTKRIHTQKRKRHSTVTMSRDSSSQGIKKARLKLVATCARFSINFTQILRSYTVLIIPIEFRCVSHHFSLFITSLWTVHCEQSIILNINFCSLRRIFLLLYWNALVIHRSVWFNKRETAVN